MRLRSIKKIQPLRNLIAYKWIKPEMFKDSQIYIPESIYTNDDNSRLGHHFACEVIAIGPEVTELKPGDYFVVHEYNKVDQATNWDVEDIMFCEECHISGKLKSKEEFFTMAKPITEKMEKEYEEY